MKKNDVRFRKFQLEYVGDCNNLVDRDVAEVSLVGFISSETNLSTFDMIERLSASQKNCIKNVLLAEETWPLVQLSDLLSPLDIFF